MMTSKEHKEIEELAYRAIKVLIGKQEKIHLVGYKNLERLFLTDETKKIFEGLTKTKAPNSTLVGQFQIDVDGSDYIFEHKLNGIFSLYPGTLEMINANTAPRS